MISASKTHAKRVRYIDPEGKEDYITNEQENLRKLHQAAREISTAPVGGSTSGAQTVEEGAAADEETQDVNGAWRQETLAELAAAGTELEAMINLLTFMTNEEHISVSHTKRVSTMPGLLSETALLTSAKSSHLKAAASSLGTAAQAMRSRLDREERFYSELSRLECAWPLRKVRRKRAFKVGEAERDSELEAHSTRLALSVCIPGHDARGQVLDLAIQADGGVRLEGDAAGDAPGELQGVHERLTQLQRGTAEDEVRGVLAAEVATSNADTATNLFRQLTGELGKHLPGGDGRAPEAAAGAPTAAQAMCPSANLAVLFLKQLVLEKVASGRRADMVTAQSSIPKERKPASELHSLVLFKLAWRLQHSSMVRTVLNMLEQTTANLPQAHLRWIATRTSGVAAIKVHTVCSSYGIMLRLQGSTMLPPVSFFTSPLLPFHGSLVRCTSPEPSVMRASPEASPQWRPPEAPQ
ncbi:hypothetical protein CYMTET_48468 [Cymbomonas tetramitiformis]|uniref:Mediator of RNA polymerase II transcription subunit 17 n=1 Tax=Cymbomonas tetramitiformis TaxID=36881 RepID=A0AAE0BS70_9CHLO|nr:hypothetical protein CYMTET_48468 [Cymbomonas tetramitiformis]